MFMSFVRSLIVPIVMFFFFFKQKTAYEMRISDWSSDVCSSDLKATLPVYPGDLVVREDKAVIADAIRRFAGGAARASDLAVRLKDDPDEPVVLSIAGARGLGEAAVLLSLTDNSEEDRDRKSVA